MRVVLLLVVLAGCIGGEDVPTTVEWQVTNDGPDAIEAVLRIEDVNTTHEEELTIGPGETAEASMQVASGDATIEIQLRHDARESSGVPIALDPLCSYRVEAQWDGEEWDLSAAPLDCP